MKVKVNKDLCIGCGACNAIADEVFTFGDDNLAEVKADAKIEENQGQIQDAHDSCPTGAIEITKE